MTGNAFLTTTPLAADRVIVLAAIAIARRFDELSVDARAPSARLRCHHGALRCGLTRPIRHAPPGVTSLLPPEVALVVVGPGESEPPPLPAEQPFVGRVMAGRRREFAVGRACARAALRQLEATLREVLAQQPDHVLVEGALPGQDGPEPTEPSEVIR